MLRAIKLAKIIKVSNNKQQEKIIWQGIAENSTLEVGQKSRSQRTTKVVQADSSELIVAVSLTNEANALLIADSNYARTVLQ